jgi:protein gp37
MADRTHIEWTDATWNPITGCTLVSDGCKHCYAATLAATRLKHHPSRAGLARLNADGDAKFTGEVRFNEQWLDQPLRWRKPRHIFVCAHGDLFHESVPDEWIDRVFAVMALAPHHTFQVLTKRAGRALEYLGGMIGDEDRCRRVIEASRKSGALIGDLPFLRDRLVDLPLPNVWLGVSVEDQDAANKRIPDLLRTPAAIRFVSAEPLLGPVDLTALDICGDGEIDALNAVTWGEEIDRWRDTDPEWEDSFCDWYDLAEMPNPDEYMHPVLDQVIVGGESGKKARPMHPEWARSLRDQCVDAGVKFFFKQWGEWLPGEFGPPPDIFFQNGDWMDANTLPDIDAADDWCDDWADDEYSGHAIFRRVGKRTAGRLLDGREWNEVPG